MQLDNLKLACEEVIKFFEEDMSRLRTGRASPALVENIIIDAYGAPMQIKGVASVVVTDARSLSVEPWDKSLMKAIEEGIRNAGIGLNPVNDGRAIRINIPPPTEESRRQLTKLVGQKAEEARIRLRQTRDEMRSKIILAEENGEITEDDRYSLLDKLDEMIKEYNEKIKELGAEKETEIMTV